MNSICDEIYRYYYEYVEDFPGATYDDWAKYRNKHWDEFHGTEWFDDLFSDTERLINE